jgi:hypothetical protein
MRFEIARPKPVPRFLVLKNGSKIFDRCSGRVPGPSSRTSTANDSARKNANHVSPIERAVRIRELRSVTLTTNSVNDAGGTCPPHYFVYLSRCTSSTSRTPTAPRADATGSASVPIPGPDLQKMFSGQRFKDLDQPLRGRVGSRKT